MELNFPQIETKILKFWEKNKIFEKSIKQRKKASIFVFYEGPPFANGLPGIHHLLSRSIKDVILRYKTMKGFYIERKAGWDTHGLPTEMEAEKKLGIKNKKEIEEKIGIKKFIETCRNSVFTYKKEWEEFTERIAFWLDLKRAYITCSNDYVESLWWILKKIWQKGFLYQDYKVVPYCVRCGTSLSSHEVAQGYKTVSENSIYVKFPVKGQKDTYFLAWTTTPWTLPGNVALAVGKDIKYVKTRILPEADFVDSVDPFPNKRAGGYLIFAKDIFEKIPKSNIGGRVFMGWALEEEQVLEGKDLVGLEYEPVFDFITPDKKAYYVVAGDFISTEEGTGLVHIAPAFGEEDMKMGKENNLPILLTVDEEGKFKPEVKQWAGMFVKNADPLIIEDLKKRNLLFKEELYEHDYPFCWRCDSPLLYYAKTSWFIKTTAIKKELIKNNEKINWEPKHIKKGRFGEWLKEVKDWNLSRERYWGTPLPIWRCQTKKCDNIKIIGSIKELEKLSGKKIKDLHRPLIDEITFKCEKCGGRMKRESEVIDCWFDSGSMPFGQAHWPFAWPQNQISKIKNQKLRPPKLFPADFIAEGIDQTRGWFYTLLVISTLLGFGPPYKNVICHGLVLDSKGQKMSKSRGNVVWPNDVIDKYGADAARWYFYTVNQPGDPKLFSEGDVEQELKKFILTLWNCYTFLETYFPKKEFSIFSRRKRDSKPKKILDKWIISKLNNLIQEATQRLDNYDVTGAARAIESFVVEDLSLWYIRRSRRRFQKPESKKELEDASTILGFVLLTLSKTTAPFVPFLSEEIFQCLRLNLKQSVHLEDWPKTNKKLIDKKLEDKMIKVREVVALALSERAKTGIKVRQPLQKLKIKNEKLKIDEELLELIKDEVNVKEIVFDSKIKNEIELDTKITSELKEEGIIREIVRHIQEMRKKAGLKLKDKILVRYLGSSDLDKILAKNKNFILKEAKVKDLILGKKPKEVFNAEKEIDIDQQNLWLAIKKL